MTKEINDIINRMGDMLVIKQDYEYETLRQLMKQGSIINFNLLPDKYVVVCDKKDAYFLKVVLRKYDNIKIKVLQK